MSPGSRAGFLFLLCVLSVFAAGRKKAPEPYAVVGGTVFREPGFALPGAEVTLLPDSDPDQTALNIKKTITISDSRGEFVFRVPTAPMRYKVRAAAKGYGSQQKQVSVEGEQRVDATFTLSPESK